MPLHSPVNEYHGVNAHLHSYFQNKGGWEGFHNKFIGDIAEVLSILLPPNYSVDTEQSLQIHLPLAPQPIRTKPDITIYDLGLDDERGSFQTSHSTATLTQTVLDTMIDMEPTYYSAILIYEFSGDETLGIPVTRIELLSPTNKTGPGYWQYIEKRSATLRAGLRLVEVDLMHQTPSPVKGIPNYGRHQEQAFAYTITVSNPTPDLEKGLARTYSFAVDTPIPVIEIPLSGEEVFPLDFNTIYHDTYKSIRAYSLRVDYEQLPLRFETYSPDDQARISSVMERVQKKFENTSE
ncbi:MAG: DUF4058 family protein [bacterium]|nr:DUF4058 family protein [bacterium]